MTAERDVVVTGVGVLCATAADADQFAAALRAGACGIGARPNDEVGEHAELRPRLSADLSGFDFRATVAARSDLSEPLRAAAVRVAARAPLPVQATVAVALEGWQRAGLHRAPLSSERIGVVVAGHNLGGRYADQVRPRYATSPVHLPARYPLHFMDTDHVGAASEVLGITGEGYTVGAASASGNVAIINASRLVASAAVDACLVLGALTDLAAMELQGFYNLGAMAGARGGAAPPARCRPFDGDREGFVPGQGAACLVLESGHSAARRSAPVWARLAGHALRLDANSLADPRVAGEAWVMAQAIRRAGLTPDRIGYVNAHGTGSTLGDQVEVAALREVFGAEIGRPWINSTKGLVGHCLCAAGVVEAVATIVQMRDGFVHPNANLRRPIDPRCRFVGARAEQASIEFALSNGFGFGGFNTSVLFGHPDRRPGPGPPSSRRQKMYGQADAPVAVVPQFETGRWLGGDAGVSTAGAAVRLFCFAHAGGGAAFFRPWRRWLAPDVDVRPVVLPGRESRLREQPYRRIEPLLEPLCAALVPHLDRPYALFGHSVGAILAYEVARRFSAGAGSPAPLCLLVSGRRAPRLATSRRLFGPLPEAELLVAIGALGGTPPEVLEAPQLVGALLPALRGDFELNESYRPLPGPRLRCPVAAYMGAADPEVDRLELLSWHEESSGAFTMRVFAGDHFYLKGDRPDVPGAIRQDLAQALAAASSVGAHY